MSEIEYELNSKSIIDKCCAVINAETKPNKSRSPTRGKVYSDIDKRESELNMTKLLNANDTSHLEDLFKTI